MRDLMKQYIGKLLALELCCKDGHYEVNGLEFRGLHVMFDQMINGIGDDEDSLGDMRDNIQEIYCLGRGEQAFSGKEILESAIANIKDPSEDNKTLVKNAKELMMDCLTTAQAIMDNKEITIGEEDMISSQAKQLQHRIGFLFRTLE